MTPVTVTTLTVAALEHTHAQGHTRASCRRRLLHSHRRPRPRIRGRRVGVARPTCWRRLPHQHRLPQTAAAASAARSSPAETARASKALIACRNPSPRALPTRTRFGGGAGSEPARAAGRDPNLHVRRGGIRILAPLLGPWTGSVRVCEEEKPDRLEQTRTDSNRLGQTRTAVTCIGPRIQPVVD